jgi:hypothetical protein
MKSVMNACPQEFPQIDPYLRKIESIKSISWGHRNRRQIDMKEMEVTCFFGQIPILSCGFYIWIPSDR